MSSHESKAETTPWRALFWARQGGLAFDHFKRESLDDPVIADKFAKAILEETQPDKMTRAQLMATILEAARNRMDPSTPIVSTQSIMSQELQSTSNIICATLSFQRACGSCGLERFEFRDTNDFFHMDTAVTTRTLACFNQQHRPVSVWTTLLWRSSACV